MRKISIEGFDIRLMSTIQNKNTIKNITKVLTDYKSGRLHRSKSRNGRTYSLEVSRKERLVFIGEKISYLTHEAYNKALDSIK